MSMAFATCAIFTQSTIPGFPQPKSNILRGYESNKSASHALYPSRVEDR